jgi:hypothetical protein
MINWMKQNVFSLLATAVLATFAGVWIHIMRVVADFEVTTEQPTLELATGIVSVAGLIGTTISTITASALGFTVSDVKRAAMTDASVTFSAKTVGAALTTPTLFAVITYIAVSVGVFFTWIANEEISPEVLEVFALSSIGWLIGSASVAFKTTET